MAEKVQVDVALTGADKAAKGLDDVAQAAGDVEDHDKIDLKVDSNVDKVLGQLDVLNQDARAAATAAEALGQALGPELSGRSDLPRLVAELDKLGVSADEVAANADQLAAKLREVDSEDLGGGLGASLGTAKGKTDDLADSARGANSALANMVGNSAQDLGALGGLAGSAGVAFGQMGEYAADAALGGEKLGSALKSMATVAGPIAVMTAALAVVQSVMKANAAGAKAQADAINASEEAFKKGGDAAANYSASLSEAEKITVHYGNASVAALGGIGEFVSKLPGAGSGILRVAQDLGLFGQKVEDITPTLQKAGVTVEQWTAAVAGGQQGYGTFATALGKTSLAADEQANVMSGLVNAQKDYSEGQRNAAAMADVFHKKTVEQSQGVKDLNDAYAAADVDRYANQQKDLADTLDRVNKILTDQADALNAQVDAAGAAADSQVSANEAFAAFGAVLKDNKAKSGDVRDAAVALAKANVQLASDQAKATGAVETSTQSLDGQNKSLLATAAAAKGPARSAILDYVGSLNQIPPDVLTEIQADIDRGDLAAAQAALDAASAPRKAAMQADANTTAAHSELDNTANPGGRPRTAFINVQATGFGAIQAAANRLFTNAAPASTTVNVNVPRGTRPDDMVRAADRYARRNGRPHAARR